MELDGPVLLRALSGTSGSGRFAADPTVWADAAGVEGPPLRSAVVKFLYGQGPFERLRRVGTVWRRMR